jgi:hypothetical protein
MNQQVLAENWSAKRKDDGFEEIDLFFNFTLNVLLAGPKNSTSCQD